MSNANVCFAVDHFLNKDEETSLVYYELANELGMVTGTNNAAWLHDRASRFDQARLLFEEVYRRSPYSVDALLKLGDYAYYGRGGQNANATKAASLYRAAAELNNSQGNFNLGYLYEHGEGVGSRDLLLAREYYRRAVATLPSKAPLQMWAMVRLASAKIDLLEWWEQTFSTEMDVTIRPTEAIDAVDAPVPVSTFWQSGIGAVSAEWWTDPIVVLAVAFVICMALIIRRSFS